MDLNGALGGFSWGHPWWKIDSKKRPHLNGNGPLRSGLQNHITGCHGNFEPGQGGLWHPTAKNASKHQVKTSKIPISKST